VPLDKNGRTKDTASGRGGWKTISLPNGVNTKVPRGERRQVVFMKRARFAVTAAAMTLLAGCIVSDEVTTVTIRPDGSADLIKFNSNIRSGEEGSKGDEELRQYVEKRQCSDPHEVASANVVTPIGRAPGDS
jgi:hypothetical protein